MQETISRVREKSEALYLSEAYNNLKEIHLTGNNDYVAEVDKIIKDFYAYSHACITKTPKLYKIEEIDEACLKKVRLAIEVENVIFQCAFFLKQSSNLVVCFNGARKEIETLFSRASWYSFANASFLVVDDPTIFEYKEKELGVAWYWGTQKVDYLQLISKIVKKIEEVLNVNQTVYFGSSGGGHAALSIARYTSNTIHIAQNPQIYIDKYFSYSKFVNITQLSAIDDPLGRNNIPAGISRSKNKFFIVQNLHDKHHINKHLFPLLKELSVVTDFNIALTKYRNLLIWLYDSPLGHKAFGDKLFFSNILYFSKLLDNEVISEC